MKKGEKKPIKARRRWVINPKTRIKEKGSLYKRSKTKQDIRTIHEREKLET